MKRDLLELFHSAHKFNDTLTEGVNTNTQSLQWHIAVGQRLQNNVPQDERLNHIGDG